MDLLLAVSENDLEKARDLIQSGMDVNGSVPWNAKDTYSPVIPVEIAATPHLLQQLHSNQVYPTKPLTVAVLGGYLDMVRLLLSAGADINSKDGRGRTALICAIYGLDLEAGNINTANLPLISQTHPNHLEMMKSILLRHPNLHVSTLDSPQYEIKGITPLCLASYLGKADIIQLLLDDGRINVDGTDSKQATALMYASRDGNVPIVKMLLSYQASPDATDNHGWSAIQYAERSPDIVQACEEALRCTRPDVALLHAPTRTKYPIHYTKLSALIATLPSFPSSLSHLQFNVIPPIDLLDPQALPLVQIIQNAFLQAIKNHDHLSLQALLLWTPPLQKDDRPSSGPLLINHHDSKTGMTCLHHAMRTKPVPSLDTIAMLYQAGADMNAQTYYGRTALHHLARFGLDTDGKKWGIQKGGKPENVLPGRRLSIQSAASRSDTLHTPDTPELIHDQTMAQHLALCTSLLIRLGALVSVADVNGNTPLHFAAEFGGVPEVLKVLVLEGHADLATKNKKGWTAIDVCRSDDILRQLYSLENERRKALKTVSTTSLGGSIRPFETASEISSLYRSPSLSTVASMTSYQESLPPVVSSFLTAETSMVKSDIDGEFDKILRTFFRYQTTLTDSIEGALNIITESILHQSHPNEEAIGDIAVRLKSELREAHEMFDCTEERAERVIFHYKERLEAIEKTHQIDWDMSEQQHDKIEKLFDVFERIDRRFYQLELDQDSLMSQIETLRKALVAYSPPQTQEISKEALANGLQTLKILKILPMNSPVFVRQDRSRLCAEVASMVETLVSAHLENQAEIEAHWKEVERLVSLPSSPSPPFPPPSPPSPTTTTPCKNPMTPLQGFKHPVGRVYGCQTSLNHLELTFDILASNLREIQNDLNALQTQKEAIVQSKQQMYNYCLQLEHAMATQGNLPSLESELQKVLETTQTLFEHQDLIDQETRQLKTEKLVLECEFEAVETELKQIRPPVLLQGLLERLETEQRPPVQVEKDWKEDSQLVCVEAEHVPLSSNISFPSIHSSQDVTCLLTRLDASLYCLKIVASHHLAKSRQRLVEVHAALGQASAELEASRVQMRLLYDDAANVARQVFTLKTELETIVQHRKEEIIKVWEVVDEVLQGMDHLPTQPSQCAPQTTKERTDDKHEWVIRELEQLQFVHQDMQEKMVDLRREQCDIGQSIRQCANEKVESQVDALVGHNDSLLTLSDQLTDLMVCVRQGDLGLQSLDSKSSQRLPTTHHARVSCYLPLPDQRCLSVVINAPKKRLSTVSMSSMSSLSSCQQERMLSRASHLSQVLSQTQRKRVVE
ncbi:hypothetical protein BDF14DRAFT_1952592 [Spinellus fusiger]|nr:hypothetical protein BDF14DRAFT_1952592 [Spinellus fusiger]